MPGEIDPMLVQLCKEARHAALTVTEPPLELCDDDKSFWLDFMRNRYLETNPEMNYVTVACLTRYGLCAEVGHLAFQYIVHQQSWQGHYAFCCLAYQGETTDSRHLVLMAIPLGSTQYQAIKLIPEGDRMMDIDPLEGCLILDPQGNCVSKFKDPKSPLQSQYIKNTPLEKQCFYIASPILTRPYTPSEVAASRALTPQKISTHHEYLTKNNPLYACVSTVLHHCDRLDLHAAAIKYLTVRLAVGQIQGGAARICYRWIAEGIPHIPPLMGLDDSFFNSPF